MTLEVAIRKRLGAFALKATFASDGRLTALWGASGSGKTSLVNLIGGLDRPDAGRIAVDGRVLVDTTRNVFVPKHRRRIGYVFQDARLLPHLTVRQNLAYGRFFAPRGERYVEGAAVVAMLGLESLLDRRPSLLSGGEKQRVAIGRALLASPRLVLMDEPLASLDERRKAEILPFIERLRDEMRIPIVYVSHALSEVARLATDIVAMENGSVVAHGSARTVMERLDLLPGEARAEGGAVLDFVVERQDEAFGLTELRAPSGLWRVPRLDAPPTAKVRARVRARDIMLTLARPEGVSALNVLPGTVVEIREDGAEALVTLDCGGDRLVARITRFSLIGLGLSTAMPAHAVVKAVTFDGAEMGRGDFRG